MICSWNELKKFLIDIGNEINKDAIGVMHKGDESYIRFTDGTIIDLTRGCFEVTLSDQPSNYLDKDRGWAYFGNADLFDVKL